MDFIERLPPWARPAAYGGIYIGSVVALRAIGAIIGAYLRAKPVPAGMLLLVPAGFVVGIYVGAVGGLTFSLVRPALARGLGRIGDLLAGILCTYAYMLSVVVPLAIWADGEERAMIHGPAFWVISGGIGLVIGGVFAKILPRVSAK